MRTNVITHNYQPAHWSHNSVAYLLMILLRNSKPVGAEYAEAIFHNRQK